MTRLTDSGICFLTDRASAEPYLNLSIKTFSAAFDFSNLPPSPIKPALSSSHGPLEH